MKIPKTWTFHSSEVASHFDDHVREQLPWYELMTGYIRHVVSHYLPHGGLIYDIGASTGNVGRALAEVIGCRSASLVAVEESQEMAALYDAPGQVVVSDACDVRYEEFDVAVLYLCLMFISPSRRGELLEQLRGQCRRGGCILVVDKFEPTAGYVGLINSRVTMAAKLAAGAAPDKVLEKELSLVGVQRPLSDSELPGGAKQIFQFGDFRGLVIDG